MTLFKQGTTDSSVALSSSVYNCGACGHTEMKKGSGGDEKKCPKCGESMTVLSSSDNTPDNV